MHILGVTFYVKMHICPRFDAFSKISYYIRNFFSPFQGTFVPKIWVGGMSMIRKEKKYTACPKCLGNMRVRKDGSYKCRLCKSVYTHEEYIASVSKMLLSDINRWNESESKMADVRKLNMLLDKWNKQFE